MDYKKESILLIEKLNKRGMSRSDIANAFGKKPSWITEALSRGGNKSMYSLLKTMYEHGLKPDTVQANQAGTIMLTFEERIEELLDDKKTLKESIQLSLNAILRGQEALLSGQQILLERSAENENRTLDILRGVGNLQGRSSSDARQLAESGKHTLKGGKESVDTGRGKASGIQGKD